MMPSMKGSSEIDELFVRMTKIKQAETDFTIMQDAFDANGSNGPHGSKEIKILQGESQNQLPGRSRGRRGKAGSFCSDPVAASTPASTPMKVLPKTSFHDAPRNATFNINTLPLLDDSENNFFTPPTDFQDNFLPPPPPPQDFANASEDQSTFSKSQPSLPHFDNQNAPESDEFVFQPIECPDLKTLLSENSLEYETMTKLKQLWKKNVQHITVNTLLSKGSNKVQGAKTFSSLLCM